jgi:hypothetical protein
VTEPTASNYPTSLDSDVSLGGDAVNLASFTLDASIDASITTISVTEDISAINVPCYLLCGSELIYATAKSSGNFTSCDRGAGGTSAASHTNGDVVYVVYAANLFNQLKRAIIAIETELGTSPSSAFSTVGDRITALHYLPNGTMINGKISPTVASNHLTIALKTIAGTDPSATDPVYVMINGSLRSVTNALSVTVNAGANSFNAGSSELATKEIDYFPYLGWRASSSAVVIGFSRIPYATVYSQFSATATNEKYGVFSTAPASTDDVVNVGRFAATLSAGAGYTWTVPTFTSTNLIQRPCFETRKLSWTPTVTSGGGTHTTVTLDCSYMLINNQIHYFPNVTIVNKGTATGNMKLTPPMLSTISTAGGGQDVFLTGLGLSVSYTAGLIYILLYDTTTPWVDGYQHIAALIGLST